MATTTTNRRRTTARGDVALGQLLRQAEKSMVRLQRQRDKITEELTGARDHIEMNRLGAELAAAQAALDEAEERWLTLAEEAE
jgi:hypothetical protein